MKHKIIHEEVTLQICDCGHELVPRLINVTMFDGETVWDVVWSCPRDGQADDAR